ncbi:hypothetical protein GCM10010298_26700 [Streptomyces microflavus]|uniref:Peptidase inhibitor family I36 n=2 Tax=Streptomyces microflavus TaxID=1919 RepID=A0A7J0CZJ3_STRMI|nr:hypothetical protein Smic_57210 [Streptomyces microflavus]GGX60839.1 hypothetical protein GCM10010298_26700 [Streptomyces microflavus]
MGGGVKLKKSAAVAVTLVAALGMTMLSAGSASAATSGDGYLASGEMGFFYLKGQGGPVFDPDINIPNFSLFVYTRQPQTSVNDNTLSYWNRSSRTWYVYTDSFRGGVRGSIPAGHKGDASANFANKISSAYNFNGT